MKCCHCGGDNIETGIAWGQMAEIGIIGLVYKGSILSSVVQVYSDVCLDCGEIVRTYIKDTSNKKWHKKGPVESK